MTTHSHKGERKLIEVINSDVYCVNCGQFLGMTCDPFRESYHEECYPDLKIS